MPSKSSFTRRLPSVLITVFSVSMVSGGADAKDQERITADTQKNADGTTENRYYVTLMTQTFDGAVSRSQVQKAGFARLRKGDESWVRLDLGDGALVTQKMGALSAGRRENAAAAQTAVLYDFKTQTMSGNPGLSAFHNDYIRPLLDKSPALGQDTKWRTELRPSQLGFRIGGDRNAQIDLSRHYFEYKGRKLVLLEYTMGGLDYANARGARYTQSGHGVALADPGFGQVYWTSSLYVGKSTGEGRPRQYRYARTSFAMDGKGRALIDIRKIPEVNALSVAFYGPTAQPPLPFAGPTEAVDQLPLQVASVVDVAAFAMAENSANQLAETIATAAFGGGGSGQSWGANVDIAINDFIVPASSLASGAVADITAATKAVDAANAEIVAYTGIKATLSQQAATALDDLKSATAGRTMLLKQIANEAALTSNAADFTARTADLRSALATVNRKIKSLQTVVREISLTTVSNELKIQDWASKLPLLQKAYTNIPSATALSGKIGTAINGIKGLSGSLTALSWLANGAGIAKNVYLMKNFDPNKGGDLQHNGTYDGWLLVGEIAANLASAGGDFASGNFAAVVADVTNFAGGRISDIYMSYTAMDAANQQALYAEMQANLTRYAQVAQNGRNMRADIDAALADADRIGKEITALKAQISSIRTTSPVDWQDPRIDPNTGLPKPAYWQWLKNNDPDKLRAMGIDPNAPVGGWPRQTPPTQQADTEMPQQPGVDAYPKAKPIKKRPKPATDTPTSSPADATNASAQTAVPASTSRPSTADQAAKPWQWQATTFTLDNFSLGQFSLAGDWTPVTFDPVTWTPPVWTPVTWSPPTWVPVTFNAPTPSALPWTTINDGSQYPATAGNMAYSFASIDGRVATDLSPYSAWLKTQNQHYLEQLAVTAGYPNLASALADSANLKDHAGNPGFQQWAWSAPVADPFVSADIDESQHVMARAQFTLGDLLLKSNMSMPGSPPRPFNSQQQPSDAAPALCGR